MQFVCTRCKRDVDTPGLFCPFCGTAAPQPGAEPEDPYIGRTLAGKYFVNQRLGRGGMGAVYKATHLTLDRPVALKLLHRALLAEPSMVQRFHREARAASRLNHPNCIGILDFGEAEDGSLFIAMEFLSGRSLSKLLADEFPLGQGRVVRMVAQMLSALAEAHAAGIVHRDLKPSNVVVEPRREEPDFVKVLDFGIAKLAEPGDGRAQLTGTGMVCGTPGYMSPEQARGEELDARSDLYAVGVILYELLTGRLPFDSETPMGLVAKHMAEAPLAPRERRPDLDIALDLDALVVRALAKDPADRPQSAEEMRAELLAARLPPERERPPTPKPDRPSTVFIPAARDAASPAPRPPSGSRKEARERTPPAPSASPAVAARRTPAPGPSGPEPASARRTPAPREADAGRGRAQDEREPRRARPAAPRATGPSGGRPGRGVLLGAAAGLSLAVGILGWLLFGGDPFTTKAPEPGGSAELVLKPMPPGAGSPAERPPVEPGGAAVQAPGAPVEPAPPPAPPPETTPAPPPEPPEGPRPQSPPPRPAPRKGDGVRQVAEGVKILKLPDASSGEGLLLLTASPWAVAYVDGREIGETPRELRVGEGYYRVKLEHPTLGKREATVTVQAGRRASLNVNLAR